MLDIQRGYQAFKKNCILSEGIPSVQLLHELAVGIEPHAARRPSARGDVVEHTLPALGPVFAA